MKRWLLNTGLVLVSVALTLIAFEAALWIVAPPAKNVPFENGLWAKTDFGVGLRPNVSDFMDNRRDFRGKAVHTDARGRRVVPAAAAVAAPARRVWLIGDSQTFGYGLSDEETWANLLQQTLLEHGYRDTKVLNLGVPGINVDQYFARFRYIAPQIRPGDVVLVGLTWNDLVTTQDMAGTLRVVDGFLASLPDHAPPPPAKLPGAPASTAAPAAPVPAPAPVAEAAKPPPPPAENWRVKVFRWTGLTIPSARSLKPFLEQMAQNSALASFLAPHIREVYFRLRRNNNPFLPILAQGAVEANFAMLSAMAAGAGQAGARFAVLFLPSRFFFEDAVYDAYSQGGKAFPARNYQNYLARPACEKLRLRCLDPFDILLKRNLEGLVFPIDGHYNPRGATLVAAFAAGAVTSMLGPPPRDEKPRPAPR